MILLNRRLIIAYITPCHILISYLHSTIRSLILCTAPGDYSALNTQIVFTNGQMTGDIVCATLDIIDDNVVEENEELLSLTLTADDPPVTTLTASSATIDIRENNNDGN